MDQNVLFAAAAPLSLVFSSTHPPSVVPVDTHPKSVLTVAALVVEKRNEKVISSNAAKAFAALT